MNPQPPFHQERKREKKCEGEKKLIQRKRKGEEGKGFFSPSPTFTGGEKRGHRRGISE